MTLASGRQRAIRGDRRERRCDPRGAILPRSGPSVVAVVPTVERTACMCSSFAPNLGRGEGRSVNASFDGVSRPASVAR